MNLFINRNRLTAVENKLMETAKLKGQDLNSGLTIPKSLPYEFP